MIGLGTLLLCLQPTGSSFTLNGDSLSLNQRDFRVFNNFSDRTANNHITPDPNFPGYTGATLAIWKGAVEWGSELHGDGSGDPFQGNLLGSGGANFDFSFQGEADGIGHINANVISELSGDGGSTLAFTEGGPFSNGWRIRYYSDPWIWNDNPAYTGGWDLQGLAVHQLGGALGLGLSTVTGSSMAPGTATGEELRSIGSDDQLGIQAIYGVKSPTKPHIAGFSNDLVGGVLTVHGTNFTDLDNQVWFTRVDSGGDGTPIKVIGLASTDGGTRLQLTIPNEAGPGDILVKRDGLGGANLSNAFPIDPALQGTTSVTQVSPPSVPAVTADGPPVITVTGVGLLGTLGVSVDGIALPSAFFTVVSDTELSVTDLPVLTQLGSVPIEITTLVGVAAASLSITAPAPVLDLADSLSEGALLSTASGLQFVMGGAPGDVHFLAFSGSLNPSIFPGFVSFDIGNNFFNLFDLGTYVVGANGAFPLFLPLNGDLTGLTVHFQAAVATVASFPDFFPLTVTNLQSGTFAD